LQALPTNRRIDYSKAMNITVLEAENIAFQVERADLASTIRRRL